MSNITRTLAHIDRGAYLARLDDDLTHAVKEAQEHGKAASLTIKVTVKPASRGGALQISAEHTVKTPKPAPADVLLFADDAGDLHTSDPRQAALELRQVSSDSTPIKTVG